MATNVVLDVDPGHDDAIALLLALGHEAVEVDAVTTVAGNGTLPKTTRNARRVLALADRADVPVAAGMAEPLVRSDDVIATPEVHGESALDGPDLPEPDRDAVDDHAVDVIRDAAREGSVTLVPTGPLTNVATALRQYPAVEDGIDGIVLMGGAAGTGNYTPAAEYNILVDPEAAAVVFDADVPVTMVGLDVTRESRLGRADIERIRGFGDPVGPTVAAWLDYFIGWHEEQYGRESVPVHDALAVGAVIDPGLVETEHLHVAVETSGDHTLGRTVCDRYGVRDAEPNAHVALGVDRGGFVDLLCGTLEAYSA
ncbi:nucleoside hydrolase [Halostella salina]|uniref:nucleoside hydrolase n=1 Tax=Halostella salina TaxID=1547897 RepID=UPI000EF80D4B|nr:nucleoside hydrolase [Halostella salina]